MKYDPRIHNRRSIRLKGYDYSRAGAYFVTFCTRHRICNLGEIIDGVMVENECGAIIRAVWEGLPKHYPHVGLDEMCIMPNHVHAIIVLKEDEDVHGVGRGSHVGRGGSQTHPYQHDYENRKRHGLPEIVRALKSFSARHINEMMGTQGTPFWQRNYYERIIRSERHMNAVRKYIRNNPLKWELDRENPDGRNC